jgi:curli production assembly/transport component CsgG
MRNVLTFIGLTLIVSGCASMFNHPMTPSRARLGEYSEVHKELHKLPAPREKIVAAVYQFRDQTGQYKASEMGASWSTAVTQGATTMLLQSLDESGWFVPIEREGLSNLLNERRIIRSSREQYQGGSADGAALLPPLLFGGITLEGGIISYQTNILTGGAGLRYFGTGASGEYREDKVTVYLRAVSTSNGRILKTVHTSKTILSQKLNAGMFRFVSLTKLLEAETGYTYNEPSHMAVQEAIDKAVYALIVEGILDGLWGLNDMEDINHKAITGYKAEKETVYMTDHLGFIQADERRKKSAIGIGASMNMYEGDFAGSQILPGADIAIGFAQNKPFSMQWNLGVGRVEASRVFHANYAYSGFDLQYRLFNNFQASPYVRAGGGVLYHTREYNFNETPDFNKNLIPYYTLGFGYEWLVKERTGLSLMLINHQMLKDDIDGMVHGKFNDRIWTVQFGIKHYFNVFKPKPKQE